MRVRMVNPGFGGEVFVLPEGVAGLVAMGWVLDPAFSPPPGGAVAESEGEPVVDGEPAAEGGVAGAPRRSASRKEWAAFAESLGIDPGVLNRGELIAAVDAL